MVLVPGRRGRKLGDLPPCIYFGQFGKKKYKRAFENIEKGDQVMKQTFLYIFWKWVRMYIGYSYLSMLDFIDWLSLSEVGVVFFVFP